MRSWSPAFTFVMGIINLFGDVTYEGGASINGPFMVSLGANAAVVSVAAGASRKGITNGTCRQGISTKRSRGAWHL